MALGQAEFSAQFLLGQTLLPTGGFQLFNKAIHKYMLLHMNAIRI